VAHTRLFTPTTSSVELSFESLVGGIAGPALDDVRVTLVRGAVIPEPATVELLGGGLGMLGLVARRRRRA
jgi:hypothetical protein